MSIFLLLPVLLPIGAGCAVLFVPKTAGKILTVAAMVLTLALAAFTYRAGDGILTLFTLSDNLPIFLRADGLGKVFACLISLVWLLAGVYSFPYMAHEGGEKRFYCLYLCTLGALMGLCFSGSIITFYMFFESITLLTTPMVMHSGKKAAVAAGIKYLIYNILGASLVLLGIFALSPYATTFAFTAGGTLDMSKVAGHENAVLAFSFLMLVGFSAKAGLFPLHGWLPTAHPAAPSPASAVLSGIITKAGVLGVIRLMTMFLGTELLRGSWVQIGYLSLALVTIFTGSLLAYHENHIKKRLAWSSVSQVSYVLLGLSTLHPVGFLGALLHILCHSLVKNCLFMSAGAIILKTEKTDVRDLTGIGRQMPLTMAGFTLASLCLVGIPPFLGFVSKWYLAQGALDAAGIPGWLTAAAPVVLLISALLTAGYLFPIVIRGFFVGSAGEYPRREEPWQMWVPLLILAVLSLLLGVFTEPVIRILTIAAQGLLG